MRARAAFVVCAMLLACSSDSRDEELDQEQPTGASQDGTGEGDDAQNLDVPAETTGTFDPDAGHGCEKVDFLFVIDHSGSMADEQQALIASFPPFITAIRERTEGNFHVMVADVDGWVFEECEEACVDSAACEAANTHCEDGEDCWFPCALRSLCRDDGEYVCGETEPHECEDVLGAGVTYPRGRDATSVDCAFANGKRYMDTTEPNLAAAFGCAAAVGTGSSADTEKPMEAMVAALTAGPAAGCNEGFLRDDAILVVTFITDENDEADDSLGTPSDWYEAVVAAKNGDPGAVVVLGLFGDNDQPGGICQPLANDFLTGAEPGPRLRDFVQRFGDQGHIGTVCASSYEPFFEGAVESIGVACDDFVPPQG